MPRLTRGALIAHAAAPGGEMLNRSRSSMALLAAAICLPAAPAAAQVTVHVPDEVPYGWWQDDRGRISQVNFDLKKRLFVGGYWGGRAAGVDFGLLEFQHNRGGENDFRVRVALVQGNLELAPFTARIKALHLDLSARYRNPLLRIVTFIGPPRRLDGSLN